jgi:O-antigen ligase
MTAAIAVAPADENNVTLKVRPDPLPSAMLFGVFALLLGAPLAFGAVEPWAIFILEAGSILLFALWAIWQARSSELQIAGSSAFRPMLAFGGLIIFQLAFRQTAYRAATMSTLLLYCSYAILGFLLVQCLQRTWQVHALAGAFSVYGFTLAAFSFVQGITTNGKLYWIRTPRFGGWIYGPYVNHNHYAGLMEMLTPFPLIIFLSPRAERRHKILAAFAAAVMGSTIFVCGSRGGMAALAVQMIFLLAFVLRKRRDRDKLRAAAMFLALGVALLAFLGGGELMNRVNTISGDMRTELSGGTRLTIDRDCLRIFLQKPLTGWGVGTFAEIYPQFRSFSTSLRIDKAHNDYLQLLVETGALGFVLMAWFLFSVCRAGIRKLKNWPDDLNAELALAALIAISGILVHSLVDFNLQIPANAALFFALCAVSGMEPHPRWRRSKRRHQAAALAA